ncbi:MAG: ATPase [Cyclobacteriaceae bacterium]|nr:ATPase [Cyclobacteriaceae bacterium]MCH8515357.1 ATPase [Cyclobacteriaceae bacterium]
MKRKIFYSFAFVVSLMGFFTVIFDLGFPKDKSFIKILDSFYFITVAIGLIATFMRYYYDRSLFKRKIIYFDLISIIFALWLLYMYVFIGVPFETDLILENPIWLKLAVLLTFVREFSSRQIKFTRKLLDPAQLFILSFISVILLGTVLLMLPNATVDEISFTDALFTSTSAVCVTGLVVLDTGSDFTIFGQTIIMLLIQVGGLGLLTFVSYFTYFFKGGATYENQIVLSSINSSIKLSEVFITLKYVILISFGFELIASTLIYLSLDMEFFTGRLDMLFFSIFHSISAFCNAGFSTLSDSLYDKNFRFNYPLHLVIVFTFIIGGLGFPIVVNVLNFLKIKLISFWTPTIYSSRPWLLNLNSRITLITTLSITLIAVIAFYLLEYDNTLAEHSEWGKIVTAFFGAATPRTAGFNTVDTAQIAFPTLMMVFLLMWIGASAQSTGGGIKVTTFAVAILNVLSLAKGKDRIELFRREIADISVKRAFAVITLSLGVIFLAFVLLMVTDSDKKSLDLAFECFSAYSTVGLSLGVTGELSTAGKYIIVAVMFIGRISMLTLVTAVFVKIKQKNYRYSKEEITIN